MSEIINGLLSCLASIVSLYFFGYFILNDKDIKDVSKDILKKHLIICLISTIPYTIIFLTLNGTIKTVLLCILSMIFFKLLFKTSYIKSLFASIVYIIIIILPDLLTLTITTKILGISKEYCDTHIAGSIISNTAVCLLMISLTYILKKPLKKLFKDDLSTSKKIILVSALTLISLAIFFYQLISNFKLNNNIFGYLIVIIALIVILFYLFKQRIDNEIILKRYDDLLNIMKNYESDIEEQRTLIHETRNELMTIKCKINDKERETEIIQYIDSILGDKVSSNMSKYSKFKYLPSNGLKGFFYYKFNEAEQRGITVSVNISKQIEKSFLSKIDTKNFKDLVRMIGVYLDNAIDASATSKDKKLGIEVYLIKKDIEIIISNTYNDANIDMVGKEKYTTKGKNHGYGLLLVKGILKSNKMFESTTTVNDNLYVQKLKIKGPSRNE